MLVRKELVAVVLLMGVFLIIITAPYIYAFRLSGEEHVFGGFLLNPIDGNSYLAKMYEGYRGEWKFSLPYTAQKGEGAYLFMFYLVLGHLSRITSISLIATFHISRIIAAVLLLISLYRFIFSTITQPPVRLLAFALAALGGGAGWTLLAFGLFTSDFWVAETYPFLSSFANPHFTLGLAMMLFLFTFRPAPDVSSYNHWLLVIISALMGIIMPFGVVIVLVVSAGLVILEHIIGVIQIRQSMAARHCLWIALGGLPILVYDLWVISQDALLSNWNAQNITPSPPIWDLLISLSPVLILAVIGILVALKMNTQGLRLLVVWAVFGLALVFVPWGLQRRFLLGIFIPLSALAALGFASFPGIRRHFSIYSILLIILVIPTNVIVLMAALNGIATRNNQIFHTRAEFLAYRWIAESTRADSLFLASPDTGLYIPAQSGRRVFYGHPFETTDAEKMKVLVTEYFLGDSDLGDPLLSQADYVFFGPREQQIGDPPVDINLNPVYENSDVTIYQVNHSP